MFGGEGGGISRKQRDNWAAYLRYFSIIVSALYSAFHIFIKLYR